MSKVWMKVTNDEYELPIAVADSVSELAKIVNAKPTHISSAVCHGSKTYLKIEVEDDVNEE